MFGIEEQLRKELQKAKEIGILDVFAGTLNAVALAQEEGIFGRRGTLRYRTEL
jgi:hypothetical protein